MGDVVVPALYTNLMLRFDRHLFDRNDALPSGAEEEGREGDENLYLHLALLSYAIGLCAASYANQVTSAGQPALLYIVPSMLFVTSAVAIVRGEFGALSNFKSKNDASPTDRG